MNELSLPQWLRKSADQMRAIADTTGNESHRRDLVAFAIDTENAAQIADELSARLESALGGEYICSKCGLRKSKPQEDCNF